MAKILIIEDDEGVSKYICRLLDSMGHDVTAANDGGKGYDLAEDKGFQIILTDLYMPGRLSEMELVRKLRERRPDCPIIVCSGYPTQERIEECEELGITDFLTKPFEMSFIKSVIERLLNKAPDTQTSTVRDHDS